MIVQPPPKLARSSEELLHQLDGIQRDFAERVQRVRDRKMVYRRPLVERYIEGQVSIVFDFCLGDWNGDGQCFVDSAERDALNSLTRIVLQHNINYSRYTSQGNQEFVLVPDIQTVNCAEKAIPSFAVWSEFVHDEEEKIGADGVYLHASKSMFQLVPANVNWEAGLLAVGERGSKSRKQRMPAVVDGGLEIVYSIPDYQRKIVEREGTLEIVMEKLIASLRIDFTRNALSFWRTEISNLSVQFCDMFIGPFDFETRCFEDCHT